MEELALQIELARLPIDGVACHRQVDRREMHADLMRPAGLEPHVEERVAGKELSHLEMRNGLAGLVGVERMPQGITAVAPDRRLDPAGARAWSSNHEGGVVP